MDNKPLTIFERAQLRLEAWKALDHWGNKNADGSITFWDWEERIHYAKKLAARMANE